MTTKQLIQQLKEIDPKGNDIVTIDGVAIEFVEGLPGYYDGNYSYLDNNGNYIKDSKGNKINIRSLSIREFIDNEVESLNLYILSKKEVQEIIENKIIYRNNKENVYREYRDKCFNSIYDLNFKLAMETLQEVINSYNSGTIFIPSKDNVFYHHRKIEKGKETQCNVGECYVLNLSEKFKIENDRFILI